MDSMKQLLLKAPDSQLDHCMFPLIKRWDSQPRSIQILEVLDHCIYGSLASGFVVTLLQTMLDAAMHREKTTLDELVKQATWRDRDG